MYVHARTLAWIARRALFRGPFSLRRYLYAAGFGAGQVLLGGLVSFGRSLDALCYPDFTRTRVPAPLFVIATPRSGTTYLHHLLSLDEEHVSTPKLYQTIAPSIVLERTIERLAAFDRRSGRVLERLVDAIDSRMFTDWDSIHRVALRSAEEDESLFVYSLTSPALYLLFPFIQEMPEFVEITRLGRRAVRRVARDYRDTLKRWAYASGDERTPLIKNVLLPSRLAVSDRAFPDARYIHVLRDPRDAIPSAVSMFYRMWQSHSPGIAADSPATRALAGMFLEHYRLLCEQARKRPADRWIQVRYEALIDDPVRTVEGIYAVLGWSIAPRFRTRLEQAAAEGRRFKSRHRYDSAEFGLTEADLRDALGVHWEGALASTALG